PSVSRLLGRFNALGWILSIWDEVMQCPKPMSRALIHLAQNERKDFIPHTHYALISRVHNNLGEIANNCGVLLPLLRQRRELLRRLRVNERRFLYNRTPITDSCVVAFT